ncbi:2-oxoadipate dioxygenase/decarboxylase family protein [Rhodococcus sp. NPDC057529]|uniref:2-oxoadipate dioxygenase/decarboxylase family protein n=1 Tax=Rhodococcus sp. NPDC057529 TaxID=3346158 RepID=UPI0036703E93
MVETWELRARFARALGAAYSRTVPAYDTLAEVADEVNADFSARNPADAERRGGLARIIVERHGAIRLGGPTELRQAAILFSGFGMHPVGCYDRRGAPEPEPVVSTVFRPVDPIELARNPFGMLASMLTTADRRFFDGELQHRLENVLAARTVFPTELLHLAALATEEGGLTAPTAERFVALAAAAFAPSDTAADRSWLSALERVAPVAADVGGRTGVRVVHLAPRVFDIDELCRRSARHGLRRIDGTDRPHAPGGPDVLVRWVSFGAAGTPGGVLVAESRGIALTPEGQELYDDPSRGEGEFPLTEAELEARGLAYFTHRRTGDGDVAEPILYEDFPPMPVDSGPDPLPWLSETLGRAVHDPFTLYRQQQDHSRERTAS